MNDDWLKHIHDTMSDFETEEPEKLWEAIESKLPTARRNRRKVLFAPWMRFAAAAVVCALIAIPVYMAMHTGDSFTPSPVRMPNIPQKETALLAMPEVTFTDYTKQNTPAFAQTKASAEEISVPEIKNEPVLVQDSTETTKDEPSAPTEPRTATDQRRNTHENPDYFRYIQSKKHKSSSGRLAVSLAASSGTGSLLASSSEPDLYLQHSPSGVTWYDSPTLGMLVSTKGSDIETEYNHKQPVKTGISFMYSITDRISVGSGLTYSYLASDVTENVGASTYSGSQKLHYLGIPVNIRFRAASLSHFDFYAIAGAAAEKCISSKFRSGLNDIASGTPGNHNDSHLPKPFQFSVNVAAGIQYNISEHFGIYAEPRVGYYFDDGSTLQTYYKDKPFNFNFDFGLRVTFE